MNMNKNIYDVVLLNTAIFFSFQKKHSEAYKTKQTVVLQPSCWRAAMLGTQGGGRQPRKTERKTKK